MAGLVPPERGGAVHQCFPLYSLLLALNNPKVNYFSLDIEGAELQVLHSVPWHLVDIEVISVEIPLLGQVFPGSREELHNYLEEQGYQYVGTLGDSDDIFVTLEMWNGSYYFDKRKMQESWQTVFSYHKETVNSHWGDI